MSVPHPYEEILGIQQRAKEINLRMGVIVNSSTQRLNEIFAHLVNAFYKYPQYQFCTRRAIQETDPEKIIKIIDKWQNKVDAILIVGGTGYGKYDSTPDIILTLADVEISAYPTFYTMLTYDKWKNRCPGLPITVPMNTRLNAGQYNNLFLYGIPDSYDAIDICSKIIGESLGVLNFQVFISNEQD